MITNAAARHVLTAEEFAKEMSDPRIEKFVVTDHGRAIALTTMTPDLSVVEWINAEYFRSRYPDAAERGALFYLGYTLVDRNRRRSNALLLMATEINRRVSSVDGVVGFDICEYNNAHGIGRFTAWLFGSSSQIETLDTQTYYAADYRGHSKHSRPRGAARPPTDQPLRNDTQVVTLAERLDLADEIGGVLTSQWASFMLAGEPGHQVDLVELLLGLPEHQVLLLDGRGQLEGVGLSVPVYWDGTVPGLPAGWDGAVDLAARQRVDGVQPNAACALSITIAPESVGRRLASSIVQALKQATATAGGTDLLAPIRPILKSDYPLIPMAEYAGWRRADGATFDPWLRLHQRLGGEVLAVAPTSMTVTGSVADWSHWCDQEFPGSGSYVIDGGLAPLLVDLTAGTGTYQEPNIWLVHRL